jgi:predicted dienelactone hydrolase
MLIMLQVAESLMPAASAPEGLPAPTGRHQVGRASFDWVDPARVELYSANPADRRELVVWVWYPAAPSPGAERAAYLPEPWAPPASSSAWTPPGCAATPWSTPR